MTFLELTTKNTIMGRNAYRAAIEVIKTIYYPAGILDKKVTIGYGNIPAGYDGRVSDRSPRRGSNFRAAWEDAGRPSVFLTIVGARLRYRSQGHQFAIVTIEL